MNKPEQVEKGYSPEFLMQIIEQAKKHLPGWMYAALVQSARPVSGGQASHRVDEPDVLHKMALAEIKPSKLKDVSDEELTAVWLRLSQWYANAKRRKQAIENYVNAGLWVRSEMSTRGMSVKPSEFVEEIDALDALKKSRSKSVKGEPGVLPEFLKERLEHAPEQIMLVRDFASIAGSAAVTEKPNDIDVVIRAEYDHKEGSYLINGTALGVALRRVLTPDKRGPQVQLLSSPAGSFTDYVPMYDLVAVRREHAVVKIEAEPPKYVGQERVVKAEKTLTLGKFFAMPKPTRPAIESEPMTVDGLVKLFAEKKEAFPLWVQKKYDGANHQIHKDGENIVIYSEDGDDNTSRLPSIVEAVKKLEPKRLILCAEIEKWDGEQHLPRETVAGYLAERSKPDDSMLTANVYDVIWDEENIHDRPYSERLEHLKKFDEGTMSTPGKRALNFAPGEKVDSAEELRSVTERIRKLPGSEGVVAKRLDSPYRIGDVTGDDWVKYHNCTLFDAIVLASKRTKGGVYTYSYGVRKGKDAPRSVVRLGDDECVPVGESFATSERFDVGDKIQIEAEAVNKIFKSDGVEVTAWVPRVIGASERETDTIDSMITQASKDLVLQVKKIDEKGETQYFKPNVIKEFHPELVPSGETGARVCFVCSSPSALEIARHEMLVGRPGDVFKERYLRPLNLRRDDISTCALVPELLLDDVGKRRDPNEEEITEWSDWVSKELERLSPELIIALGSCAGRALGERATLTLPHPSVLCTKKDSGEVERKLKRIRPQLERASLQKAEEGGTRSNVASSNWAEHWWEMLPKSGNGRFVYQHHWRGLDEEESKLNETDLFKVGEHSVHGDLRLEGNDGELWGFTVFLGEIKDNQGDNHDKLIDWNKSDNVEIAPKLVQPKEWLDVGVKSPLVHAPGGVGSTTNAYSKFFAQDKGTYELGVAREHAVEIFLDGGKLKGRYLLLFAPISGRRLWLIDKPEDQTPTAEKGNLAATLSELRGKKQRFLIWGKPGERPRLIDVQTGRDREVKIVKSDPVKKIVYGIVLDPYGADGPRADAHNDWVPPADVEKTAHAWLRESRVIGLQHNGKANAQVVESWCEQYPAKQYKLAMRNLDHSIYCRKFGNDILHSGAWVLGVQLGDKEWELFEQGKINAFSPGGYGVRKPMTKEVMPKVTYIDLVEAERDRK